MAAKAIAVTLGVSVVACGVAGADGASSSGLPSIGIGPQTVPGGGYTVVQPGDPTRPPVILIPPSSDSDGSQVLAHLGTGFPDNPLTVVNYPAAIGFGFRGVVVVDLVGTGTYQQSVSAGVDGLRQAIAARGAGPVEVLAMSQGDDVAYQAALAGVLPAGSRVVTMGDPNLPNGIKQWIPIGTPGRPPGRWTTRRCPPTSPTTTSSWWATASRT
ncbi:alpha/beta hydrolase family protein [Tsukamurella soli]|uniref:hypothetical protein n=1 Tax=Tsukamurella soli TaxID=644556 RepID=UPI0036210954